MVGGCPRQLQATVPGVLTRYQNHWRAESASVWQLWISPILRPLKHKTCGTFIRIILINMATRLDKHGYRQAGSSATASAKIATNLVIVIYVSLGITVCPFVTVFLFVCWPLSALFHPRPPWRPWNSPYCTESTKFWLSSGTQSAGNSYV